MEDTKNPYEFDETIALQHDLAMAFADGQTDEDLIAELNRRNAPLPTDCKWIRNPYSRFNTRLVYRVPEGA